MSTKVVYIGLKAIFVAATYAHCDASDATSLEGY